MDDIAGVVHRPDGRPQGVVALTHGAGGSREAPLLQAIELANAQLAGSY